MVRWLSGTVAVLLTVALVWFGVDAFDEGSRSGAVPAAAVEDAERTPDAGDERADRGREASGGHGPPSWAQGQGRPEGAGGERAWHSAWKRMSPTQRERTMSQFAEEHAAGVRAWATCMTEKRSDCEKPLPPGLAKKQLKP